MKKFLLWLIRGYKRFLSPLFPPACKFYPTCSDYMAQAVQKYGAVKGLWLGIRRLLKCHPFHDCEYDPVP